MTKNQVYAMIPARIGSTRLKMKNLALVNDKPLISYAIEAAKKSDVFEKVFVNSEHEIFNKIANRYNVNFYQRPQNLGSSNTMADSVVYDFMKHNSEADIVAWVNPTSPLQTTNEINGAVEYFIEKGLDSLITVEDKPVHCMFDDLPVNYNQNEIFSKTQDLRPVQPFVYSVMIWRSKVFIKNFEEKGHAFFSGKFGTFSVSKLTGIIIKKQEDLMIVDNILRNKDSLNTVEYDPIVNGKIT